MRGWKFTIRHDIYFNEEFSHSLERYKIVHSELGLKDASSQVILNKGYTTTINSTGLIVRSSDEYIAYTDYLGIPFLVSHWEYTLDE